MTGDDGRRMRTCTDDCLDCYRTCFGTAMTHCLESGGKHLEPSHFRLMIASAEMRRRLRTHRGMDECVTACRACAESCRAMAT